MSEHYQPMPAEFGAAQSSRGVEPRPVQTAKMLMFLRAAIGLVSVITILAFRDDLREAIRKKNPDYDAHKLDTAVNVGVSVGIVVGVIFLVLYVLLAIQVGRGKQWARIVTWILAALGVISAIANLAQTATGLSKTLAVIGGVIDVAIIILLAVKESNRYFAAAKSS